MVARLDRNRPLPEPQRARVDDPATQRAFDSIYEAVKGTVDTLRPVAQPEKWQKATFITGWEDSAFGFHNTSFKKDPLGVVRLRGLPLRSSGASAVIMTLPIGYRPAASVLVTTSSNNAYSRVDISTSGDVTVVVGTPATWVSLDGIAFDTED